MELRELQAFVAIVEEGGMSAAARRLHITQPALSQTVSALERRLGVKLLIRDNSGASPTDAGTTLLAEARALLARHDQAVRALNAFRSDDSGFMRLGVPLELPHNVLTTPLKWLAAAHPETRVQVRHLCTGGQLTALYSGALDVSLLRERPSGSEFDAMLVIKENLGVLLSAQKALELSESNGIRLENLSGLEWVGFARCRSPLWYDELTSVLRNHGLDIGPPAPDGQPLIAEVKVAAVASGKSFALAPANWSHRLPESVVWCPLVGQPLVRRTWLAWPANSRRRDVAGFIARFPVDGHNAD
ncbi:LysR family transcriptional regulator [Streptomyces chiangmaiensis]|uniref:LysR family transcriptional regulator n=1 Tax=Streptomyces chiangmaiensis TaxID=766497 RepID=A0ABU7G098_9ACTN|nr:LysR family transcriptional regulator [Streptomyces chiangmaiensis]MED7828789.1 LysR family transcriptional regulator [Streptomyces chiangmaiensis]